jgi:betaine reductase
MLRLNLGGSDGPAKPGRVKELAGKYGNTDLVVVIGGAEAEACGLAAETVSTGDPTYAGPLTGVPLGLKAYHIFELKAEIPPQVYEEQVGMMEMVLDVDAITKECAQYRAH